MSDATSDDEDWLEVDEVGPSDSDEAEPTSPGAPPPPTHHTQHEQKTQESGRAKEENLSNAVEATSKHTKSPRKSDSSGASIQTISHNESSEWPPHNDSDSVGDEHDKVIEMNGEGLEVLDGSQADASISEGKNAKGTSTKRRAGQAASASPGGSTKSPPRKLAKRGTSSAKKARKCQERWDIDGPYNPRVRTTEDQPALASKGVLGQRRRPETDTKMAVFYEKEKADLEALKRIPAMRLQFVTQITSGDAESKTTNEEKSDNSKPAEPTKSRKTRSAVTKDDEKAGNAKPCPRVTLLEDVAPTTGEEEEKMVEPKKKKTNKKADKEPAVFIGKKKSSAPRWLFEDKTARDPQFPSLRMKHKFKGPRFQAPQLEVQRDVGEAVHLIKSTLSDAQASAQEAANELFETKLKLNAANDLLRVCGSECIFGNRPIYLDTKTEFHPSKAILRLHDHLDNTAQNSLLDAYKYSAHAEAYAKLEEGAREGFRIFRGNTSKSSTFPPASQESSLDVPGPSGIGNSQEKTTPPPDSDEEE